MLPDVKLPADEICRIIWWTKARRGEEIAGAPTHPREGSQVCANCLRDPYLSPPIKPISLGDTRISYFLPEQHESCPYFSVGGLWLDLLRHNPWLAHIWRAAAQIYFLLLISFSRTLLHPINFRLWKDRIRHDWTEPSVRRSPQNHLFLVALRRSWRSVFPDDIYEGWENLGSSWSPMWCQQQHYNQQCYSWCRSSMVLIFMLTRISIKVMIVALRENVWV